MKELSYTDALKQKAVEEIERAIEKALSELVQQTGISCSVESLEFDFHMNDTRASLRINTVGRPSPIDLSESF